MSISNFSSGASRSVRHTVEQRCRVAGRRRARRARAATRRTLPASCASIFWARASVRSLTCSDTPCAYRADRVGAGNLLLQLQDPVDQRLGGRRAARHVDVHRHDAVAAAHHGIGIVVVAAAVGARAHGDDPARLGHLVVDLAQRRGHLVDQRAGHDHDVRLARARPEHDAEAVEVVARGARVHHLDRAAGEPEGHRPQAIRCAPS